MLIKIVANVSGMSTLSSAYDRMNPWFWVDIETSGLDPNVDEILEIYIAVTDKNLEVWDTLHLVMHHPYSVLLAKASTWCKVHFCSKSYRGNGLFDECNYSNTGHLQAEILLWNFFEYYSSHDIGTGRPQGVQMPFMDKTSGSDGSALHARDVSSTRYSTKSPHRSALLAGSTVHFDRQFLLKQFPSLRRFLSHKSIDVTTILETCKRFGKDLLHDKPRPTGNHRAGEDILDSINLLKFFKARLFEGVASRDSRDSRTPRDSRDTRATGGGGHEVGYVQPTASYADGYPPNYTQGPQGRWGQYGNISKSYPS